MPSAVSPNPRAGATRPDELENLFNYDDAVEEFLKDLPIDKDRGNNSGTGQEPAKDIDEEITVKKKRKPVAKLDEARLLSQSGIPKLRKVAKSRLNFRGKGHEFSDISGLLSTYQLWLDDMFPRAKFRDALGMVEKLGHSKRMQVMRKAWLDDTKPQAREPSPNRLEEAVMSGALPTQDAPPAAPTAGGSGDGGLFGRAPAALEPGNTAKEVEQLNDAPDDDELDALLAENATVELAGAEPRKQAMTNPFEEDDSDGDELDALLADQGRKGGNEYDDEEEIMAGMDMW